MKILQTIQGMSASSGGPSTCTRDLLAGLYDIAPGEVDLFTLEPKNPKVQNLGHGTAWLKELPYDYFSPLAISKNFKEFLQPSDYDLYHCNALWMYSNHITCKVAREKNKPYILTPHGMLYPTALNIKRWKKWPMLKLWFEKDIMNATCIHATCEEEAKHVRSFGYKGPIAVIPNPVVIPNLSFNLEETPCLNGGRVIGFLGRLHPIKKIDSLLEGAALAMKATSQPFTLEIMGKGTNEYEAFLKKEVDRLGLQDFVNFVGFLSGEEKYRRLSNLSALMVPSAQENFGMIVPEALICKTPVYASLGTPWKELNTCHCGWWRDNSPETIAQVIQEILVISQSTLDEMGENGKYLIEEKYEQHKVAQMMIDLYQWILNNEDKPSFIYE